MAVQGIKYGNSDIDSVATAVVVAVAITHQHALHVSHGLLPFRDLVVNMIFTTATSPSICSAAAS
jgi:hypothetical protein